MQSLSPSSQHLCICLGCQTASSIATVDAVKYSRTSAQDAFLRLLSRWYALGYRDTRRERACLLVVRSHRLLLHVLSPLTNHVIATKHSAAPQNTSSPLTDFNHTCAPTPPFNPTTSTTMSDILGEKASSDVSSDATTQSQQFQDQLEAILRKLKSDASSITADEARVLSENVTTSDERAVRIISAVEYLAIANKVCIIRDLATIRLLTVRC